MGDRVTAEVVAKPTGAKASTSYPYFRYHRDPNGLAALVKGLSSLQPALRRYAESEDEKHKGEALKAFADKREPTKEEMKIKAFSDAYNNLQARASVAEFQSGLTEQFELIKTEGGTAEQWEEAKTSLLQEHTSGMAPAYLEHFLPHAQQLTGTFDSKFKKHQVAILHDQTVQNVSKIIRSSVSEIIVAGDTDSAGKDLRDLLTDLQGNAKQLGVKTGEVSALFTGIVGEIAELENRPELLQFGHEPDASGIRLTDTSQKEAIRNWEHRAQIAKDKADRDAEVAETKRKAELKTQIGTGLLFDLLSTDSTDLKKLNTLALRISRYTDPKANADGVVLNFGQTHALLNIIDRLKQRKGFPESSNRDVYNTAFVAAHNNLTVQGLNTVANSLSEHDFKQLLNVIVQRQKQEHTSGYNEWRTQKKDAERDLMNLLSPTDKIGNALDPTNGPMRVKKARVLWETTLSEYVKENQKLPTAVELDEISDSVAEKIFKKYPLGLGTPSQAQAGTKTPPDVNNVRNRLRSLSKETEVELKPNLKATTDAFDALK